ncbi:hypothetical protein PVL29_027247 [Vitis rotundifolia]|uniref:Uncharacterized protein n=1 Tax=Vitis rotundifolia TaxID=103349 RepID=A0AA38YIP2_VITRO|nr:hypothetical protein PVL29_027247 [Vitis rotundifolia]
MVMEEKVEEEARASGSESSLSTLHLKLLQVEQELYRLKSRRKEDSKANIHADVEEIACLRAKVAELEWSEAKLKARVEELTREVGDRKEMLHELDKISPNFFSYFPHYFLRKIVEKIL